MFRLNRLPAAIAAFLLIAFAAASAQAELRIDITQGTVQPMPIAITDFYGQQPNDAQSGANIAGVIRPISNVRDCSSRSTRRPSSRPRFPAHHAALRRLARDQRPGPGQRHGRDPARRQAAGRIPALGRFRRAADGRRGLSPAPRRTGAASPTWSPTRSISASRARTAISIPASSMSPNRAAHQSRSSAWPSWIRTARTTAILTDGSELVLTPRFSPTSQEITYLGLSQQPAARLPVQYRHGPAGGVGRFPRHDLRAALLARRHAA